jgi:hypothetical protein
MLTRLPHLLLRLLRCLCVCRSKLGGAQKYFVTVEPGVDAAFVVALATLCDEIFHDQPH